MDNIPETGEWTYLSEADVGASESLNIKHVWQHEQNTDRQIWLKQEQTGKYDSYDWGTGLVVNKDTDGYKPFPPETFDTESEAISWAEQVMENNPTLGNPRKLNLP